METSHKTVTTTNGNYFLNQYNHFKSWLKEKLTIGALQYSSVQSEPVAYSAGLLAQTVAPLKKRLKSLASLESSSTLEEQLTSKSRFEKATEVIQQCYVHVSTEVSAFLGALTSSRGVNWRIYLGVVLMLVCAPFFYGSYLFFDYKTEIPGFPFYNYFHFLFMIRFQVAGILWCVGSYFYYENTRRNKIMAVPLGYLVLSLVVTCLAKDNNDVWDIGNPLLILTSIAIALFFLYGIDFFAWRKFHRADAFESRLDNIAINAHLMTDKEIAASFVKTRKEQIEFKRKG